MTLKPGRCLGCEALIWRIGVQQKEANDVRAGTEVLLWPIPTTRFARVKAKQENGDEQIFVGIPLCPKCFAARPHTGGREPIALLRDVLGLWKTPTGEIEWESAWERYAAWYAEGREAFYRAWLSDQLLYEETDVERLMRQWQDDRPKREEEITARVTERDDGRPGSP